MANVQMKRINAVFFDRDGTLTYNNPDKTAYRDKLISSYSGKPFTLPYDKMISLFNQAAEGRSVWYTNLDDEREFFRRYYRYLLIGEGVVNDVDKIADTLLDELWCNNDKLLYPETVDVLEYFHSKGCSMGVISDTSPSLEYTLQRLGIAKYFSSFTASSLVGAQKPSPIIYKAALSALGVRADESMFVDDSVIKVNGARDLGFTSFYLDREYECEGSWVIHDLKGMIDYIEKNS